MLMFLKRVIVVLNDNGFLKVSHKVALDQNIIYCLRVNILIVVCLLDIPNLSHYLNIRGLVTCNDNAFDGLSTCTNNPSAL